MKATITGILVFAVALFAPRIVQAQGTMTYVSSLSQTSTGSSSGGNDSWLAAPFGAGTNASGYSLDSIQLGMADASGSPSGFTVMLYSSITTGAILPGSTIGTMDGSLSPSSAGVYTFTPALNLTSSPRTTYSIVLTAGISACRCVGWRFSFWQPGAAVGIIQATFAGCRQS